MCIFMHFIHRSFQANSHLQNYSPHSSIPSQRVPLHQTTAEPETNLYDLGTSISLHLEKKRKKIQQMSTNKNLFFLASPPSQKGELCPHEWRSAQPQVEATKATSHLVTPCGLNSAASMPAKQKDGVILFTYADDSIVYTRAAVPSKRSLQEMVHLVFFFKFMVLCSSWQQQQRTNISPLC